MKDKSAIVMMNQDEISSYLKDVRKLKVMSVERERELSNMVLNGSLTKEEKDKIDKELLEGNLRFVITIAKQYQNQGLDLPDLIAEGNLGLMKAIQTFDWGKNLRFISYAVWWVKQSILQSLNENARTIRLPVNIVQDLYKEKREISKKGGELSDKMMSLPSVINYDQTINDEGDTLLDTIENPDGYLPEVLFNTQNILKEKMMEILGILDERERIIVEDYFGIAGDAPKTLEEIGNDFNLTKERVRQIKEKALRKLRNESGTLFDYM